MMSMKVDITYHMLVTRKFSLEEGTLYMYDTYDELRDQSRCDRLTAPHTSITLSLEQPMTLPALTQPKKQEALGSCIPFYHTRVQVDHRSCLLTRPRSSPFPVSRFQSLASRLPSHRTEGCLTIGMMMIGI